MGDSSQPAVRLLLVDRTDVLGQGFRATLGSHPELESVDWVREVEEVESAVSGWRPNVVVVNMDLLGAGTAALISRICQLPGPPVVVAMCDSIERDVASAAIEAGATAIVSMTDSFEDLMDAVKAALRGAAWLPAGLLKDVLSDSHDPGLSLLKQLTGREQEVLDLVMRGLDRRAIAAQLYCSPETVRTHIRNLMSKLNAHSTIELIAIARRLGLEPE